MSMDTHHSTAPEHLEVLLELMQLEPIFHRAHVDSKHHEFADMTDNDFWEIGASGQRYDRDFVLDTLEQRHAQAFTEHYETHDFHCQQIAPDHYLINYLLIQEQTRKSRRTSIWRRTETGWKILFHQGTLILDA